MIRGIRGATTVERDHESEVLAATSELMNALIEKNGIKPDRVASLLFSATADIRSAFPSKVMRQFSGWKYVPIMNMQEIPVEGSLARCIRILIHVDTDLGQEDVKHVYLRRAAALRPDLTE
ncbi:chorismate mutase [Heyndrickxia coagulans]|uniref:chorismate mutase n=2 Tax=Heyndrickxia coagulans TaxID=1398 RepID=A0A8B4BSE1_HEYCO|nr:chorismate mutase [Heyndrickxia coagulans]AJH77951.1 chorismate mutase [Heyndrickxia coagulans DSM 1 = ATCC 7050]MCR2845511.1 chorismate mutase [Heyndrickxia coagulans]MDR4223446.1 chorismate mutase [Heyndrickxia coagulans DSM 1 = ATCC 7050]MED4404818.1 chorismate mutase [Heyndrickxia coagulans]MED4493354.1 chorismate mutase [Heyndrickxia coagulans]